MALAAHSAAAASALGRAQFLSQQLFQAAPLEGAEGGQRCGDLMLAASLPHHKQAWLRWLLVWFRFAEPLSGNLHQGFVFKNKFHKFSLEMLLGSKNIGLPWTDMLV